MTHTPDAAVSSADFVAEQVLVSPRYFAGKSCDDAWGAWTQPMRERGWTMLDDGADTTVLISPCLRVRCGWLPETSRDDIQITAGIDPLPSPLWRAALQSAAPTEFLVAVTTWIAETLATSPEAIYPAPGPRWTDPVDLPVPDGWHRSHDAHATSPDHRARFTRRPTLLVAPRQTAESQDGWQFDVAGRFTAWRAHFSAATPRALVELFHAAFTDPEPLPRNPVLLDPWAEVTTAQPLPVFAHAPASSRPLAPAPHRLPAAPGRTVHRNR